MEEPLILVTNDDGITAPGLRALVEVMNEIGKVVVVAPERPQSGMGHAITINSILHVNEVKMEGPQQDYRCSGTPADCVKLAINEILDRKPDLCVSGINHGSNSSINIIYSGTMSAAMEAGIEGIPAIGFSLCDYDWDADFKVAKEYVKTITLEALNKGIPQNTVLNVNIPNLPKPEIKGIMVCRQAKANWEEEFDKRTNPLGQKYYWLTGKFTLLDEGEDTDEWALDNGFVSVVPAQYDLTAHHTIKEIKTWQW